MILVIRNIKIIGKQHKKHIIMKNNKINMILRPRLVIDLIGLLKMNIIMFQNKKHMNQKQVLCHSIPTQKEENSLKIKQISWQHITT